MKNSLYLFISICLMQLFILINVTFLNGEYDGLMMWLCSGIFIYACAVFGLSRREKNASN